MANQVYKELGIEIISFEKSDVMTISGNGENFGSVMDEWAALLGGDNQ